MTQDALTLEDIAALIVTCNRGCQNAGWNDEECDLIVATHIMSVLVGTVDAGGEVVIVEEPDMKRVTEEEVQMI